MIYELWAHAESQSGDFLAGTAKSDRIDYAMKLARHVMANRPFVEYVDIEWTLDGKRRTRRVERSQQTIF